MKGRALASGCIVALLLAGSAAGASSPRLIPAGGVAYPERSYVLSLPSARALSASQVHLSENGSPVSGIRIAPEGASARGRSTSYLVDYTTHANPGSRVSVTVSVQGVNGVATSAYVAPALKVAPAPPYRPSFVSRMIVSRYVMVPVVLVIIGLFLYALLTAFAARSDPLLVRVGSFVALSEPPGEAAAETQPDAANRAGSFRLLARRDNADSAEGGWRERLAEALELAEIDATPRQVVLLTLFVTALAAMLFGLVIGLLGVVAAIIIVPYAARFRILRRLAKKRRLFAEQLPDNLDVLASALRAGHSLVGALSVVAEDTAEPSHSEYRRVLGEEQLGVPLEDALKVCAVRMQNHDLDQVALVARLQREMGSNSAEVLDQVIETIRGKMELRRLVRTLTAQGRLSRWILTGLPIGLALVLTLVDPGYMRPLYHNVLGQVLLVAAVVMVTAGSVVIGKLIDIET